MSIVILGGHDTMECRYREICEKKGCKCKIFTQCPSDLKSKIGSADAIVIFTRTVAHKMAWAALRQAEKTNARVFYCNSSSACALSEALNSLV